jgi:hypothetical protein
MKKFAALTALMLLTLTAFAQNPVGAWKGKITVDRSALPKVDPQQQKMVDQALTQVEKMVIKLNMKSNKTFTMVVPPFMGNPGVNAEGTWSQKGSTITMVTKKANGQAPKSGEKPQPMTITADGKKMTMTPPSSGMGKTKITFTR